MGRDVPLRVRTPADTSAPRPTLYLLNGAGGGEGQATWDARTDIDEFFEGKNVNVVTPLDGSFTYYTDWERDDPVLGRNKWTTFLTQELPPIIDATFGTTGVNAIAGLSMSGTSVLSLAIAERLCTRRWVHTAGVPRRVRSWGNSMSAPSSKVVGTPTSRTCGVRSTGRVGPQTTRTSMRRSCGVSNSTSRRQRECRGRTRTWVRGRSTVISDCS